jgi:hypothetical protein
MADSSQFVCPKSLYNLPILTGPVRARFCDAKTRKPLPRQPDAIRTDLDE